MHVATRCGLTSLVLLIIQTLRESADGGITETLSEGGGSMPLIARRGGAGFAGTVGMTGGGGSNTWQSRMTGASGVSDGTTGAVFLPNGGIVSTGN